MVANFPRRARSWIPQDGTFKHLKLITGVGWLTPKILYLRWSSLHSRARNKKVGELQETPWWDSYDPLLMVRLQSLGWDERLGDKTTI